jgi:hypothetical protein
MERTLVVHELITFVNIDCSIDLSFRRTLLIYNLGKFDVGRLEGNNTTALMFYVGIATPALMRTI